MAWVDEAGRLSPHFRLAEFACKDGTPAPLKSHRALKGLCLRYLEPLRAEFGPIEIMSGYRHALYNARIGGAPRSHHVYDWWPTSPAVDFVCASGRPADWYAAAVKLGLRGTGLYTGHVHADARRHPARW